MKPNLLIPLTASAVMGCTPPIVGDFELTTFTLSSRAELLPTPNSGGSLEVDKELRAALRINWTYDGYALAITLDGDAEEGEDDAFSLDLTGSLSYADQSYSATSDLACTLDGDDVDCDGPLLVDGETYPMTARFERL